MTDQPRSWNDLRRELTETLGSRQEAQFLVQHVSGANHPRGDVVPGEALAQIDLLVARRLTGEPLQYVLGRWAFRSLELFVDDRALIPRPETEELVDVVLPFIGDATRVLDLGTGTGAIALAIKSERSGASVTATDASTDALVLARQNADELNLDVEFREGSWFDALEAKSPFDVIVTNPPYVETAANLDASVIDFEPHSALFAGEDGLDDIRTIVAEAPSWLSAGGVLAIEMHSAQTQMVAALAVAAGFAKADCIDDITRRSRFVLCRMAEEKRLG